MFTRTSKICGRYYSPTQSPSYGLDELCNIFIFFLSFGSNDVTKHFVVSMFRQVYNLNFFKNVENVPHAYVSPISYPIQRKDVVNRYVKKEKQ